MSVSSVVQTWLSAILFAFFCFSSLNLPSLILRTLLHTAVDEFKIESTVLSYLRISPERDSVSNIPKISNISNEKFRTFRVFRDKASLLIQAKLPYLDARYACQIALDGLWMSIGGPLDAYKS